ncbi:MAG TPA: OmpA family protein [Devosiaceae bacterium]|nr:OmpA family protein [Devosiaceae bacterium]
MNSVFLRWGLPALVTVVAGTSLAVATTGGDIAADLGRRTVQALEPRHGWASVRFDGRDALVSGTAGDQKTVDEVIARIAAVHGVRSVTSGMVLAEHASPYPFSARIADGRISLSGGVPDETAHAELMLETGATEDRLRLLAGAPPRAVWRSAVAYALDYLPHFEEGEVGLSDLKLTVSGRSASPEDFDELLRLARDGAPAGVELGFTEIVPPLALPYEWRAQFDGGAIAVSGHAPDEAFSEGLRTADLQGLPVSTSLVYASGAPDNFDETVHLLLQNLVQLESGTAEISGTAVSFSGTPGDRATAERVRQTVAQAGAAVNLDPPRVDRYFFTATRQDETIVLDGLVPDAAALRRLQDLPQVDASGLEMARGAPTRFASAVEFGLDVMGHLSEGRFSIRDNVLALHGRAKTLADLAAVETIVALGAPQGLVLAKAELQPPLASPYTWTAEKPEKGRLRLSGHVPSSAVRAALQEAAGTARDTTVLADGAPGDFESAARSGLALLPLLTAGSVGFDGREWSLAGTVATAEQALRVEAAFAEAGLEAAGWSYDVDLPPPPIPVIEPYEWRATKEANGSVTVTGFAPAEPFRKVLAVRVGRSIIDNTELGSGQPDGFFEAALAGIDALLLLDEGTLELADGVWSLTGDTGTMPQRREIEEMLSAAIDASAWEVDITAVDAPPVAEPWLWRATKAADGIAFSGHVNSEEFRRFLGVRAGKVTSDALQLASGEPSGFIDDALAGLEALQTLASGVVEYDGSEWRLEGVTATPADREAALAALASASDGGDSWTIALSDPTPAPAEEAPTEEAPAEEAPAEDASSDGVAPLEAETAAADQRPLFTGAMRFEAVREPGQAITLRGEVPADATRRYFGVIAGNVDSAELSIAEDLPDDFIGNADAGIRALASLADGRFAFDGIRWMLRGRAATDAARTAALASVEAAPTGGDWLTELDLVPPMELCQQKVASFASRNAILFQSGSATITGESLPALDELASYLDLCPMAAVHVEGHTDADGDESSNLALSVARAEAVVAALIERGVGFERLYAIGYGESLPVADNDTIAGKQANRRIAFTIVEGSN